MSDYAPPILFRWTGEVMEPHPRAVEACNRYYVIGQPVRLVTHEDRSEKTHNHYFACIAEAWNNLPDDLAERFPTSEHLRKWALIKAGYADSRQFVAASKAEAVRLASFIKPCDSYAMVTVNECVVTEWKAQSQSRRAMGAKIFQESKQKVLDVISAMIGTSVAALGANAGRAA